MKTAKAVAIVLSVTCPHCDAPIMDPDSYSFDIHSDSMIADSTKITCQDCGKTSLMPKTAGLFVQR